MVRELWSRRCPSSAPPDSSRYIFVGSAVLLLVGAEALAGKQLSPLLVGSLFLIVAVAVPRNIKLFENGRKVKLDETMVNRVEAGVEQLTGPGVKRDYAPAHDLLAASKGGAGPTSISAGQYLNAAPRVGPFGYSAAEILALPVPLRDLADAVLADDGGLRVSPATAPADRSNCHPIRPAGPSQWALFAIPRGGALIGPASSASIQIHARLFGPSSLSPLRPVAGSGSMSKGSACPGHGRGSSTDRLLVCR